MSTQFLKERYGTLEDFLVKNSFVSTVAVFSAAFCFSFNLLASEPTIVFPHKIVGLTDDEISSNFRPEVFSILRETNG